LIYCNYGIPLNKSTGQLDLLVLFQNYTIYMVLKLQMQLL